MTEAENTTRADVATLRQENERVRADAAAEVERCRRERAALVTTSTERDALRTHLRDVVIPALLDTAEVLHSVGRHRECIGVPFEVCPMARCVANRTALHSTRELVGDG